jgi:glycosyltransferase involved in cell wall biosynthesis
VQTPDASEWAARFLRAEKIHVIPNPVATPRPGGDKPDPSRPAWLERSGSKVFAAGRLVPQKGFDVLLRAFARCRVDHQDWSLIVFGEGDERGRLDALAAELGIEAVVTLPGHVPNAARLFPYGDLFVLSSRYEGFPNALLNAMACGLPAIATDCPSGPRRIVRHGVDGLLVEPDNVDALHAAMHQAMSQPDLRRRLASRAIDVTERFSLPCVMRQWNALLDRCTHSQAPQ